MIHDFIVPLFHWCDIELTFRNFGNKKIVKFNTGKYMILFADSLIKLALNTKHCFFLFGAYFSFLPYFYFTSDIWQDNERAVRAVRKNESGWVLCVSHTCNKTRQFIALDSCRKLIWKFCSMSQTGRLFPSISSSFSLLLLCTAFYLFYFNYIYPKLHMMQASIVRYMQNVQKPI